MSYAAIAAWAEAYLIVGLLIHFIASSYDSRWEAMWIVLWPLSVAVDAFEEITKGG